MSKRSDFDKISKDYYPTIDPKAVPPNFLRYIEGRSYVEPCCGAGDLTKLITDSTCVFSSDIEKRGGGVQLDALKLSKLETQCADLIITNPPFSKKVLLPLIDHFITLKPTWLLLPADLMHNAYFAPYMDKCSKVVSVGRLYWFKATAQKITVRAADPLLDKVRNEFWFKRRTVGRDYQKGTVTYEGWVDHNGKPVEKEFVRGTDNYCWYFWQQHATSDTQTQFYTRGVTDA